jgi:HD-GYP domain-containing protein (c-di-GMP phosphodiesterase class II)
MTLDPDNDTLMVRATRVRGIDEAQQPRVSSTIAYRALHDRIGIHTTDAGLDERFGFQMSIVDQDIRSVICAPMVHQNVALGVIYMDTVGVTSAFREEDLHILAGIAVSAAGAVRNATLVSRLKKTAIDTIFRLAVATEYRDDETGFHIHRMSDYAQAIARTMGYDDEFCEVLKLASPMHDVGKIGIPDSILKKPGRLSREEFEIMKLHTLKGGAILSDADSDLLVMAERIALTHHEKFDGSGYPRGLTGEQISVEGRIVAVADVFDALMSPRCYKKAFTCEKSLAILKEGAGKHFDPLAVEAFLSVIDEIMAIREHYARLEERTAAGEKLGGAHLFPRGGLLT